MEFVFWEYLFVNKEPEPDWLQASVSIQMVAGDLNIHKPPSYWPQLVDLGTGQAHGTDEKMIV